MEHTDIKINQVVVTYLNDDQVSRPPAPPIVSPCNSIMSCFAFLFLARTKQTFWTEDQFVVTSSSGMLDHDTRVAEIVVRELQKAKPDK